VAGREDRIRFDGSETSTGQRRHDYYIDGHNVTALKWISGSKFPEVFFPKADFGQIARTKAEKDNAAALEIERTREGQEALFALVKEAEDVASTAKALASQNAPLMAGWYKSHPGGGKLTIQTCLMPLRSKFDAAWNDVRALVDAGEKVIETKRKETQADWDGRRENGTQQHAILERFLSDWEKPWQPGDPRPCHGFLAWLDAHAQFDIWRTEMVIFDEETRIMGSLDAIFRHRVTGELWLYDYKFTGGLDMGKVWPNTRKGCHPTTAHLDATTLNMYSLQLLVYAYILRRFYDMPIAHIVILQFPTPLMVSWREYVVAEDPAMKERMEFVKGMWPSSPLPSTPLTKT
jgi:hypothetical protein